MRDGVWRGRPVFACVLLVLAGIAAGAGPADAQAECDDGVPAADGMAGGWVGWPGLDYTFSLEGAVGEPVWTWSDGLIQTGAVVERGFADTAHHDVTVTDGDCAWTQTFHTEHTLEILDDGTYNDDEHCLWLLETPGVGLTPVVTADGHCEWFWVASFSPFIGARGHLLATVYADERVAYTVLDTTISVTPNDLDVPHGRYDIRACVQRTDDKYGYEACDRWGEAFVFNTEHL